MISKRLIAGALAGFNPFRQWTSDELVLALELQKPSTDVSIYSDTDASSDLLRWWKDRSISTPFAGSEYNADFSLGVDGWAGNGLSALEAPIDNIFGRNDVLKLTTDTANSLHEIERTVTGLSTYNYFNIYYLVPSENVTATGITHEQAFGKISNNLARDTWHKHEGIVAGISNTPNIQILNTGGSDTYTGTAGDVIYIASMRIYKDDANFTFAETTASVKPKIIPASPSINFDGVAEYLGDQTSTKYDLSTFSYMRWFWRIKDNAGAGVGNLMWYEFDTVGGISSYQITFLADDTLRVAERLNGAASVTYHSDTLTRGFADSVLEIELKDGDYNFFLDGVAKGSTAVGTAVGLQNPTTSGGFRRLGSSGSGVFDGDVFSLHILTVEPTANELTLFRRYINA
tara:strand:+ start:7148 stop:8353 length:1206 start_codon:yes stop_codon:yes gene_type:complete